MWKFRLIGYLKRHIFLQVLIQSRAKDILPRWCRFLKGVVDSEDIPLNLSRELLQQSALIRKIREVLGARVRKSLLDAKKKDPAKFEEFHRDFGLYLKEAIISSADQAEKEDVASLLLFETSNKRKGTKISLSDYLQSAQVSDAYFHCFLELGTLRKADFPHPSVVSNCRALRCHMSCSSSDAK